MISLDMQRLTRASMTKSIARSACPPGIANAETKMLVSKTAFNDGVSAQGPARKGCLQPEHDWTSSLAAPETRRAIAIASGRAARPAPRRSMICSHRVQWPRLRRQGSELLKILRLSCDFSAHNAEVEGSSPSLTTKSMGYNCSTLAFFGILRDCGAQISTGGP